MKRLWLSGVAVFAACLLMAGAALAGAADDLWILPKFSQGCRGNGFVLRNSGTRTISARVEHTSSKFDGDVKSVRTIVVYPNEEEWLGCEVDWDYYGMPSNSYQVLSARYTE
jgi:hypothetical protein